jgi:hypothetical protein
LQAYILLCDEDVFVVVVVWAGKVGGWCCCCKEKSIQFVQYIFYLFCILAMLGNKRSKMKEFVVLCMLSGRNETVNVHEIEERWM